MNKDQNILRLKKKQYEIIKTVFKFRHVNQKQIQLILNHKAPQQIRLWLNDLTDKKYLSKKFVKEFAPKHSEYNLDKKSINYLREEGINEGYLKRLYDESTHKITFRNHCLFLVDVYISLVKLVQQKNATLHFYTKSDIYGIDYLISPNPDAYFRIQGKNKRIKRYFLDVFDRSTFMYKRIRKYVAYYNNSDWQSSTKKSFPEVILITPGESAKKSLISYIQRRVPFDTISFYITTKKKVKEFGVCSKILEKVEIE